MSRNGLLDRLDPQDWVLIGYAAGLIVWWFVDDLGDAPDRSWTEQQITLDEEHLDRIENGDSVAVRRWHGHELVLEGDVVIDANEIEDGED